MKDRIDLKGIFILICIFISFYFITSMFLEKYKHDEEINEDSNAVMDTENDYVNEKEIVDDLYQDVRILYDVVNSKFKVSQDDTIVINNITYKKIVNFDEVTGHIFTDNGLLKYITDLGSYFAYTDEGYYLAGNLVTYQTYYFRGDSTNIYIIDSNDTEIKAIIYEKWTSGNKNTLAMMDVVKVNNDWFIDNISILSDE